MAVKDGNYINIQGWMVTDLGLKGNDLFVYAIIYGFSQDGDSCYTGGLQYLADWTNSTKKGVSKNIKNLIDKGYIVKKEKYLNNIKFCEYQAVEQSSVAGNKVPQGMEQSSTGCGTKFPGGMEQSSPNNINNIIEKNIVNKDHTTYDCQDNSEKNTLDIETDLVEDTHDLTVKAINIILDAWNGLKQKGINPVKRITNGSKRYRSLKARVQEYGLLEVLRAINSIRESSFLCGRNKNGWMITFDWFVLPSNFIKVLEGNYRDRDTGGDKHERCDGGNVRSYQQAKKETSGYDPAGAFGPDWHELNERSGAFEGW